MAMAGRPYFLQKVGRFGKREVLTKVRGGDASVSRQSPVLVRRALRLLLVAGR